jgi:hypothetical protein
MRKHRQIMKNTPIHQWYAFPQIEGPDNNKIDEPTILFICPIFPCNGKGSCNENKLRTKP